MKPRKLYPVHMVVGVALAPPLAGVAAVTAIFAVLQRKQQRQHLIGKIQPGSYRQAVHSSALQRHQVGIPQK